MGLNRESAFYHVSEASPFTGGSSSSQPVYWFWGVYRGNTSFTDLTAVADGPNGNVSFGGSGESLYVGFTDRFREINVNLAGMASGGWSYVLEYPTEVDPNGAPTSWASLSTLGSSTNTSLTQSGSAKIFFDPPPAWKPASISGSARLYYVRFRTTNTSGAAPVANSILGRNYVNAVSTGSDRYEGTVPAFDSEADTNSDGYLNDTEYATRSAGKDARFYYESRGFHGTYGQMRFIVNPSSSGIKDWMTAATLSYLNTHPLADGLFVDNSHGKLLVMDNTTPHTVEGVTLTSYASAYGELVRTVAAQVAPTLLLSNTSSSRTWSDGSNTADPIIRGGGTYFEEFVIRPLTATWAAFQDIANVVSHRAGLTFPAPYGVIDSRPDGGSPTDPRTRIATLAYYYLLADPVSTFLDFYGGYGPATSWTEHWSPAAAYDVGLPSGPWSLFATGNDPSNSNLTYKVYQRDYTNALVLFKPRSYTNGKGTGLLGDASSSDPTRTTHTLPGQYQRLRDDGSLDSQVISTINLSNGEGAILIPYSVGGGSGMAAQMSLLDTAESATASAQSDQIGKRTETASEALPLNTRLPLGTLPESPPYSKQFRTGKRPADAPFLGSPLGLLSLFPDSTAMRRSAGIGDGLVTPWTRPRLESVGSPAPWGTGGSFGNEGRPEAGPASDLEGQVISLSVLPKPAILDVLDTVFIASFVSEEFSDVWAVRL